MSITLEANSSLRMPSSTGAWIPFNKLWKHVIIFCSRAGWIILHTVKCALTLIWGSIMQHSVVDSGLEGTHTIGWFGNLLIDGFGQ